MERKVVLVVCEVELKGTSCECKMSKKYILAQVRQWYTNWIYLQGKPWDEVQYLNTVFKVFPGMLQYDNFVTDNVPGL